MNLIGYILLAVLIILIILIFFVPYGVDASYENGVFSLGFQAGPFRIGIFPRKPLSERKKARRSGKKKKDTPSASKSTEEKQETLDKTEKIPKKREWDMDTILSLLTMGIHAVRRLFRCFTLNFFQLHYTAASRDPYTTALEYAAVCSAVEALPAMCGSVIRVRRRDIVIGSDFLTDKPVFAGRITLTMQMFRLVHLAVAFLVEFIHWKIKRRAAKKAAASERMVENGRQQDQ